MGQGLSVALLRPLAEAIGRIDSLERADGAAFLAELGVDDTSAPSRYVDGPAVDRALDALAQKSRDRAFGMTLARATLAVPVGILGHLVWTSGTVRDAIMRGARFYRVISRRSAMVLEEGAEVATLRREHVPGGNAGAILSELPFASLALRAHAATAGAFRPRAVRFRHAQPEAVAPAYEAVFGVRVVFGAREDAMDIDPARLDLRLATSDPITTAALESTVAELANMGGRASYLDDVRRAANAHIGGAITVEILARELGTSPRSLRRHLEQAGTSLRALVDGLLRERADARLRAGASIKEVAFELGFSEPSAFSRAYKRWTGVSPRSQTSTSGAR